LTQLHVPYRYTSFCVGLKDESKMPLLNKTIFSCEIMVLSHKSNDLDITYYLIYDHFAFLDIETNSVLGGIKFGILCEFSGMSVKKGTHSRIICYQCL
jgi:hypothetical protein